jgi:hypothetical protein
MVSLLLAVALQASAQTAVRKTGKAGNSRTSPARNSMVETSPGLCFQPGVGWQRNPGTVPPPTVDATLSGGKQAHSAGCGGISTDKKELAASVETRAKPGSVTSFHIDSPRHRNGGIGLNSMRTTPSAVPSAEASPDEYSAQVGDRAFHVYISHIKLRRLIRNAPDFRTRMKLERLENNPVPKLHHGQVAGKPTGERIRPQRPKRNNGK